MNISEIHIVNNNTCGGVNVARIYKTIPGKPTEVVCANGFSVMGFLLSILDRAGPNTVTNKEHFRDMLVANKKSFAEVFSVKTADTSKFKLSIGSYL